MKERIAYIAAIDAYSGSGVLNKLTAQTRIWDQLGVEVRLFILSKPPGRNKEVVSAINVKYSAVKYNKLANCLTRLTGRKQTYLNKILSSISLKSEIRKFNPDVILYRFGIWFPGQIGLFSEFPAIVELNSNDPDEFMFYGKMTRLIHISTRHLLLKRADGYCCVSDEIRKAIALPGVPSLVIGNGIDTAGISKRPPPHNQRAQLVFVGSSTSRWHGIDKIVTLAACLPQYDFHIVGPNKDGFNKNMGNISFHGFLEKKQLEKLYGNMDVAIGTLGLHRKNMVEASPLKVREYVAYGLPVIVGYKDTDLFNVPYILNLGNYENNAIDNIAGIVDFIALWKDRPIDVSAHSIDMSYKEQKRLKFLRSFINNVR